MANFTSAQLLAIIDEITPVFNGLRFFKYVQLAQQRIYPSIDIDESQPQSKDIETQLIDYKTRFEITIYLRYADRNKDTDNLELLERNLLNAVLGATLTSGKLILKTNTFSRGEIKDNPLKVNGIQSTLVLFFQEREAAVGIIGLQQTLDIGSISGLSILSETGGSGRNSTKRANDEGNTSINKGEYVGTRYWEYAYTKANYDTIQTLIIADNPITVTLHETGQADTTFSLKPVFQRPSVRFDSQKTVILQVEIITT